MSAIELASGIRDENAGRVPHVGYCEFCGPRGQCAMCEAEREPSVEELWSNLADFINAQREMIFAAAEAMGGAS